MRCLISKATLQMFFMYNTFHKCPLALQSLAWVHTHPHSIPLYPVQQIQFTKILFSHLTVGVWCASDTGSVRVSQVSAAVWVAGAQEPPRSLKTWNWKKGTDNVVSIRKCTRSGCIPNHICPDLCFKPAHSCISHLCHREKKGSCLLPPLWLSPLSHSLHLLNVEWGCSETESSVFSFC